MIASIIVAGLTDQQVNNKVMVTRIINLNGTVGRVGGIEEKTEDALDSDTCAACAGGAGFRFHKKP